MKQAKKNIRSDYTKKYITRTYVCQLGYYLFFWKDYPSAVMVSRFANWE